MFLKYFKIIEAAKGCGLPSVHCGWQAFFTVSYTHLDVYKRQIYGGLTYLGSTVSSGSYEDYNQAALLVAITEELLGTWGVIMMAVIVLFACLTTAIGLTSGFAGTLEKLTNGRCKYKTVVIVMSVFSFVVSNAGIDKIISVAAVSYTHLDVYKRQQLHAA